MDGYVPKMTPERVERLRRWHEEASEEVHQLGAHDVEYLGLRLHVPDQVFPPTPTSDLLGREVAARVQPGHRVLDRGVEPERTQSSRPRSPTRSSPSTSTRMQSPRRPRTRGAMGSRNGSAASNRTYSRTSRVTSTWSSSTRRSGGSLLLICSIVPSRMRTTRPSGGSSPGSALGFVPLDVSFCSSAPAVTSPTSMCSSQTPGCRARRSPSGRSTFGARTRPTSYA